MNFNVNFTCTFFQNKSTIFVVFKRTPAILCIFNKSNNFSKLKILKITMAKARESDLWHLDSRHIHLHPQTDIWNKLKKLY